MVASRKKFFEGLTYLKYINDKIMFIWLTLFMSQKQIRKTKEQTLGVFPSLALGNHYGRSI